LPPNNWLNALSGQSAWEWDAGRQQFYLHSFHHKQPDLNWSNPAVREAMKDAMRFWLERGVDGFRVDAVYWMAKEPLLSDDPINPDYNPAKDLPYDTLLHTNSRGWPAVYAYLAELARVLKEPAFAAKKRFMVTEAYPDQHNPVAAYMEFYVSMDPEVAAPFNFEGLALSWRAGPWHKFLKSFHEALGQFNQHCVASYAFGNHDQSRLATRLGEPAARSAAVLQLTLPGLAFVYYGEEIGMQDVPSAPELLQDPAAHAGLGRDPERTPMQRSTEPKAGFSTASPWLPVADDYQTRNVQSETAQSQSFLALYKQLIALRNREPALHAGAIEVFDTHLPDVLAFRRYSLGHAEFVTLINFSADTVRLQPPVLLAELVVASEGQAPPAGTPIAEVVLAARTSAVYRAAAQSSQ
jgi:alpha-glucosidase